MNINFNKCLVCDKSYPQKDLKFFKFPKDESRSKIWLDVISVGSTTLEIAHEDVVKHGKICAEHFEDSDFVNHRKKTLKPTACPVIEIMQLPVEPPTETNIEIFKESLLQSDLSDIPFVSVMPVINSPVIITTPTSQCTTRSDTFQCGRCKAQFNSLTEFMSHKRTMCEAAVEPMIMDGLTLSMGTMPLTTGTNNLLLNLDSQQLQLVSTIQPAQVENLADIISVYVNEQGIVTTEPIQDQVTNVEICEFEAEKQDLDPTSDQNRIRSGTKYTCEKCGKAFEKSYAFNQHQRTHTGERPFQCVICGRPFAQKSNVRKHMARHRVWPHVTQTLVINNMADSVQSETLSYSCRYCPQTFHSYFPYKKHLVSHVHLKVYRCIQRQCNKTFSDLDEFLTHSENHVDREYHCHVCHRLFNSLTDLGTHQYEHNTEEPETQTTHKKFKCEACNAVFKTECGLNQHCAVENHRYECPQCHNIFTTERYLRRHLATHLDPTRLKHPCLVCNKLFRTEKLLQNHANVHTNAKPIVCVHCNKQFTSNFALVRHVGLHWKRRFECPFKSYLGCEKKFYRKDKLQSHILTHSPFKIRPCDICLKSFPSLARLQRHRKKEHGRTVKPPERRGLRCLKCSQRFRKYKHLSQHHCTVDDKTFTTKDRGEVCLPERGEEGGEEGEDDSENLQPRLTES